MRETNPASGSNQEQATRHAAPTRARRPNIGLLIGMMTVLALLLVARRGAPDRMPDDPSYEWSLSFPGIPPGARFDTKPGDNLALTLSTVLPADESQWKAVLAAEGEIRIGISCRLQRQVPLWTRIRWCCMDRVWRGRITTVGFGLPPVWLRTLPSQPPTYEVAKGSRGSEEEVAGPFPRYEDARQAAADEIVGMIDSLQKGEEIAGCSGIHPVPPE